MEVKTEIVLSPPKWPFVGGQDPYPEHPIQFVCPDGSKIRQLCSKKELPNGNIEVTRYIELALVDINDRTKITEIRRWKVVCEKFYQYIIDIGGAVIATYVRSIPDNILENPSALEHAQQEKEQPFDAALQQAINMQRAIENGLVVPPGDFPGFGPEPSMFVSPN